MKCGAKKKQQTTRLQSFKVFNAYTKTDYEKLVNEKSTYHQKSNRKERPPSPLLGGQPSFRSAQKHQNSKTPGGGRAHLTSSSLSVESQHHESFLKGIKSYPNSGSVWK